MGRSSSSKCQSNQKILKRIKADKIVIDKIVIEICNTGSLLQFFLGLLQLFCKIYDVIVPLNASITLEKTKIISTDGKDLKVKVLELFIV